MAPTLRRSLQISSTPANAPTLVPVNLLPIFSLQDFMPPRTGPNGAVVKPSPFTKSHQTAESIASKIVDSTGESSDEASGTTSDEEEESGNVSDEGRGHEPLNTATHGKTSRANQAITGVLKAKQVQRVPRPTQGQGCILEDSYIVTSLHHRPWGAGDHHSTIGVFATEKEATNAADAHYEQQCASQADGWESEWRRLPREGMLQLCGRVEEGERDTETYTASIKQVQQRRAVAAHPSHKSAAEPKLKVVNTSHVYVVKEEQRMNVGEDDPRGFWNDLGDLKSLEMHGIYVNVDDANDFARERYDGIFENLGGRAETLADKLKRGMATILVADPEGMMTYSICVEKESLLYRGRILKGLPEANWEDCDDDSLGAFNSCSLSIK